jgi:hypothetical protein
VSAQPVQWTYESGGNGHWYEIRSPQGWYNARNNAESSIHEGAVGHLVTFSSAQEEQWVMQALNMTYPVWTGGIAHNSERRWWWVTNEPWEYENFAPSYDPRILPNYSHSLIMWEDGWDAEFWYDGAAHAYIVEYPSSDAFLDTEVTLADVRYDQGGFIEMSWLRSNLDAPALPDSITTYHAQRFQYGDWGNLASVTATHADTYQVVVPTSDIYTEGEPEPYSVYRIVASSSDPTEFYLSAVDSAYSLDNVPPPMPIASLVESPESRFLVCADPSIPDLGQVCIYRGVQSGFIPDEPHDCSTGLFWQETQLNNYYYRVQFTDTHGNISEMSDEIGLLNLTGVETLPNQYALHQCSPNPFNPSTTIKFSLPESSPVSLVIYDVSGRLVRTLIGGQVIEAGERSSQWNGLDNSGRQVSAGVYFAKVSAGEFTDVRRMALVK